jgi:thiol-disulfide isomerase/thioredoxin
MKAGKPMTTGKDQTISFLVVVLVVIFIVALATRFFQNRSAGLVGTMAPPVQLNEWITSQPPELDDKVYVLEFWATWCGPCVQSIPHMIQLSNKYTSVPFIAISIDRSSEPVKKMVKSKGITYYVGMDSGLSNKYSVSGVPSAFIVDRSSRIIWQGHPMSPDFEPALASALNAPPLAIDKEQKN